jgi:transposase
VQASVASGPGTYRLGEDGGYSGDGPVLRAVEQRGYSCDHSPDCKQVCIGLVVTFDGLPLGYEVFAGNTRDSRTLQTIVATMEARHGVMGRVWITDRDKASAENLAWLRQTGRRT